MPPSDDQNPGKSLRSKFVRQFEEKSVAAREAEEKREKLRHDRRAENDAEFASRGEAGVAAQLEHEKKRKLDEARWRKDEAERKRELERFKLRKQEEERYLKEKKDKERLFEEKRHKYFQSLHEDAAKSAAADRAAFAADQQLEKDLDAIDHAARDAKAKAEHECLMEKERIEHARLSIRDRLDAEHRDALIRLHGQLMGKAGLTGNALTSAQRDAEEERQQIDARYLAQREGAYRDAMHARSQAEHTLFATVQKIESDRQQKKSALLVARDKERKMSS